MILEIQHSDAKAIFESYRKRVSIHRLSDMRTLGIALAPLFAGFASFLEASCIEIPSNRIYFLTREGHFLHQVFKQWIRCGHGGVDTIDCRLLFASRLSTYVASLPGTGVEALDRHWRAYPNQSVAGLCVSLGLDVRQLDEPCRRAGLDPLEVVHGAATHGALRSVVNSNTFQDQLRVRTALARQRLTRYLEKIGALETGLTVVVDIGWRGTILDNMALALPDRRWRGYFLGLQRFLAVQPINASKYAWLTNQNDDPKHGHEILRNFRVSEMLCTNGNGTVTGYDTDARPVLHAHPGEQAFFARHIADFQKGVIDAIPEVHDWVCARGVDQDALRLLGFYLLWAVIWNPPVFLARTYEDYVHDETFGANRIVGPFRHPSIGRLLTGCTTLRGRSLLTHELNNSGWPQGLLKATPFSLGYRIARASGTLWQLW